MAIAAGLAVIAIVGLVAVGHYMAKNHTKEK